MVALYSDDEIVRLLEEPKRLPKDWRARVQLRSKRGHEERSIDVTGETGNQFHLILRRNIINALDFSVILAVQVLQSSKRFRLRRNNGKSHEHTNHIEGNTFYDYHIHMATERYQEVGGREDAYAEPTDRHMDFEGALSCMLQDASFILPEGDQSNLF